MTYEEYFAALYQKKAAKCRKSGNSQVRKLWNPNRPWLSDKYGGRVADEKTLKCRAAIISTLRMYGPLSAGQIYNRVTGFGERRQRNAKDWLVTAGQILPLKEEGRKITLYTLPSAGQQ